MSNPYTGETVLEVGGQRLTLVFNWDAIARVRAELGNDGQAKALAGDIDGLATLVAIGLAKHHKDFDAEKVKAISPPIMATVKAVETALIAAHYGPDGMPDEGEDANPQTPPLKTLLGMLWRRLTLRA